MCHSAAHSPLSPHFITSPISLQQLTHLSASGSLLLTTTPDSASPSIVPFRSHWKPNQIIFFIARKHFSPRHQLPCRVRYKKAWPACLGEIKHKQNFVKFLILKLFLWQLLSSSIGQWSFWGSKLILKKPLKAGGAGAKEFEKSKYTVFSSLDKN